MHQSHLTVLPQGVDYPNYLVHSCITILVFHSIVVLGLLYALMV